MSASRSQARTGCCRPARTHVRNRPATVRAPVARAGGSVFQTRATTDRSLRLSGGQPCDARRSERELERAGEQGLATPRGRDWLAAALATRFEWKERAWISLTSVRTVSMARRAVFSCRAVTKILASDRGPWETHWFLARLPRMLRRLASGPRISSLSRPSSIMRSRMRSTPTGSLRSGRVHGQRPRQREVCAFPLGRVLCCGDRGADPLHELPDQRRLKLARTIIVKVYGAIDGGNGVYSWKDNYVLTEDDLDEFSERSGSRALFLCNSRQA